MTASKAALDRAKLTARNFFGDIARLSTNQLISRMERTAYQLARAGEASDAKSLFIAVAELELAKEEAANPEVQL